MPLLEESQVQVTDIHAFVADDSEKKQRRQMAGCAAAVVVRPDPGAE